jgi:hypothetical protein
MECVLFLYVIEKLLNPLFSEINLLQLFSSLLLIKEVDAQFPEAGFLSNEFPNYTYKQ